MNTPKPIEGTSKINDLNYQHWIDQWSVFDYEEYKLMDAEQRNTIKILEQKLYEWEDADLANESQLIHNFVQQFSLDPMTSIEELCEHPVFLQKIEEKLSWSRQKQIEQWNTRTIDKYLFDPVNKVINVKAHIVNRLNKNNATVPRVYVNDILEPINYEYFDFDAWNEHDGQKLTELKKEFQTITVDETIPLSIQYTIYKAFERMPELHDKKIRFVWVNWFTVMPSKQHVMRSQVDAWWLLKELLWLQNKSDREYIIQVNLLEKDWVMTLPKINAKGWVMTHEFAHSLDYDHKSAAGVVQFLIGFLLSPQWVSQMERKTDETAIARGTGYELYQFRKEVLAWSVSAYGDYKRRTYLWPEEILYGILKHHKHYKKEMLYKVIHHIIQKDF